GARRGVVAAIGRGRMPVPRSTRGPPLVRTAWPARHVVLLPNVDQGPSRPPVLPRMPRRRQRGRDFAGPLRPPAPPPAGRLRGPAAQYRNPRLAPPRAPCPTPPAPSAWPSP